MMKIIKNLKIKNVHIEVFSNTYFKDYTLKVYLKNKLIYSLGTNPYYKDYINKYSIILAVIKSIIICFRIENRITEKKLISYINNY